MAMLSYGSRGEAVRKMQEALNRASIPLEIDGVFGKATEAAVRKFQSRNDLKIDGIFGPDTAAKLEEATNVRQLFLNCLEAIETLPEFKALEDALK